MPSLTGIRRAFFFGAFFVFLLGVSWPRGLSVAYVPGVKVGDFASYTVQAGIVLGQIYTSNCSTSTFVTTPTFYIESQSDTGYCFLTKGTYAFSTTAYFRIAYTGTGTWNVQINSVTYQAPYDAGQLRSGYSGLISAVMEAHEPTVSINPTGNGHWSNLQFEGGSWGSWSWTYSAFTSAVVLWQCGAYTINKISESEFTAGMPPIGCGGGGGGSGGKNMAPILYGPSQSGQPNSGGAPPPPPITFQPNFWSVSYLVIAGLMTALAGWLIWKDRKKRLTAARPS